MSTRLALTSIIWVYFNYIARFATKINTNIENMLNCNNKERSWIRERTVIVNTSMY